MFKLSMIFINFSINRHFIFPCFESLKCLPVGHANINVLDSYPEYYEWSQYSSTVFKEG